MNASPWIVFACPEQDGLLAAAALKRQLSLVGNGVKLLFSRDLSRRLAAFVDEPGEPTPVVVDLVPVDSIETLVLPALERFAERRQTVRWFYGRGEPAPALELLAGLIELTYEQGVGTWRLIVRERPDDAFAALAEAVQDPSADSGALWRSVLHALATSWDWPRLYGAIDALALLQEPGEEDVAWARTQLAEVDRAEELVRMALRRETGGKKLGVITDPTVAARVRPEALTTSAPDLDAAIFPSGPGRLIVLATRPESDLTFLEDQGLSNAEGLTVGVSAGARADIAWKPGVIPEAVCTLIGDEACEQMERFEAGQEAMIVHSNDERLAKGLDPERLTPQDRAVIQEGMNQTR